MQSVIPQTNVNRLNRILSESWDVLSQRIATGRVRINKEASLQLQYSSILISYGELFCIDPNETFTIELESANAGRNIDITCSLGYAKAAIELKCFKKESKRGLEADMYDVLKDVERLLSYRDFQVRKFICLTDNAYYPNGKHSGHAQSVTIRDGTEYLTNALITPGWVGRWKDDKRDKTISFTQNIRCNWLKNGNWYALWYALIIDLE